MAEYVYMVRSDWYDSYMFYGIYDTVEAARAALKRYIEERAKVGLNTYKWTDDDTVAEYFDSILTGEPKQSDEYKVVKVKLNTWRDK